MAEMSREDARDAREIARDARTIAKEKEQNELYMTLFVWFMWGSYGLIIREIYRWFKRRKNNPAKQKTPEWDYSY